MKNEYTLDISEEELTAANLTRDDVTFGDFDAAEYLTTPEEIAWFVRESLADGGTEQYVAHVMDIAARAQARLNNKKSTQDSPKSQLLKTDGFYRDLSRLLPYFTEHGLSLAAA